MKLFNNGMRKSTEERVERKGFYIICILFLFFSFSPLQPEPLYAQETLSNFNTSWTSVLPGTTISEPTVTSYGFCIATDARNIMGFSSEGMLLWEKKIGRVRNISLTTLNGDFILFHDKDKNIIRLFNPSGTEIWSKNLDFKPSAKPFTGRDGRFFIYGEKTVLCLGINGIERWRLETEFQKELSMQELPDGSVIVFLNDEAGRTRGLRISPFGEELEKITFAGSIKSTYTCKDGILLTFTDGSAGLFSLKNGLAESKWVASVKNAASVFAVSNDFQKYFLLSLSKSEITIYKLNPEDGSAQAGKTITEIDGTGLIKTKISDSGIFIADSNRALLLDFDFKELWSAAMPSGVRNKTINQIIYLQNDYLVFCSRNWSMDAYHTSQTTNPAYTLKTVSKNIHFDYSSFAPVELSEINYYNQGAFFYILKDSQRVLHLKEGNYGKLEKEWLSQTLSIAKLYSMDSSSSDFGIHTEKSVFETDSAGFEAILVQLALLCTNQTQNAAADIISKSSNKIYCRALLANISGYDPDGKLLEAIEVNAGRAGNKDSAYLNTICDAVYSICLFMGRPAWNKKGKDILKGFMSSGYSFNTRNYARDTLKKIISLEL